MSQFRLPQQHAYVSRSRLSRTTRHTAQLGKRARSTVFAAHSPYMPPEDWHEPGSGPADAYRIIEQDPGPQHQHAVTADEVRQRLAELPPAFLANLEVVQLSRMTRKKRSFPCYGMQWGTAIYLYPLEASLTEYLSRPPKPAEINEARMFGVEWVQESASLWRLEWSRETIRDFYLNNILIHELGHLLDQRNTGYRQRERFAEWFAIEYGYKPSRQRTTSRSPHLPRQVSG